MKIFHTSPDEINKIHDQGRFGPGLFFSGRPYYMSNESNHVYGLDIPEEEILNVNELNNLENDERSKILHIIKDMTNKYGIDEETAFGILSENIDICDYFSSLENYLNSDDDDDINTEEHKNKKHIFNQLKRLDLGEESYNHQTESLKAANILGKKGVRLRDEQGVSYLINMLGKENQMKKLDNWRDFEREEED
jgi:hypothetical protein